MEINEKYTRDKILIFDLDDTIVVTSSKIEVYDIKTGDVYELTPEEFNEYEKSPNHILKFDQFKSLEILRAALMKLNVGPVPTSPNDGYI